MWPLLEAVDAYNQVPKLNVSILFLHGRHDHCTAMELVADYVQFVKVEKKKLIWFEQSGHSPQLEEPDAFQKAFLKEFLDVNIS